MMQRKYVCTVNQTKINKMENLTLEKLNFDLVGSEFTAWEAEKLIVGLLDQKINFHKLRNLSCQEGCGKPDAHSVQRIKELQQSKQAFLATVQEAKARRTRLSINAKITVELR